MTVAEKRVRPGGTTQQESGQLRPQLMREHCCPSLTVQGEEKPVSGQDTPDPYTPTQVSLGCACYETEPASAELCYTRLVPCLWEAGFLWHLNLQVTAIPGSDSLSQGPFWCLPQDARSILSPTSESKLQTLLAEYAL